MSRLVHFSLRRKSFWAFLRGKFPNKLKFSQVFINVGFVTIQYLMSITFKNDN